MPAIAQQVGRGAMSEQAAATNDARASSCREREEPKLTRPTAGDYDRALAAIGLIRVIRVIRMIRVVRMLRVLGMIRMVRMLATPVATTVVAIIARLLRVSRLTRVAGPLWAIAHVRRRNDATAADVAAGHATARIVVCWTLTLARDEFLTRRPAATPILEDETGRRAERPHEHDPRTAVAAVG